MTTNGQDPGDISLKVMRISRPVLHEQSPIYKEDGSDENDDDEHYSGLSDRVRHFEGTWHFRVLMEHNEMWYKFTSVQFCINVPSELARSWDINFEFSQFQTRMPIPLFWCTSHPKLGRRFLPRRTGKFHGDSSKCVFASNGQSASSNPDRIEKRAPRQCTRVRA